MEKWKEIVELVKQFYIAYGFISRINVKEILIITTKEF
nr:MAG TPA: hypothetical protein [Caudoviricetes sp.]